MKRRALLRKAGTAGLAIGAVAALPLARAHSSEFSEAAEPELMARIISPRRYADYLRDGQMTAKHYYPFAEGDALATSLVGWMPTDEPVYQVVPALLPGRVQEVRLPLSEAVRVLGVLPDTRFASVPSYQYALEAMGWQWRVEPIVQPEFVGGLLIAWRDGRYVASAIPDGSPFTTDLWHRLTLAAHREWAPKELARYA